MPRLGVSFFPCKSSTARAIYNCESVTLISVPNCQQQRKEIKKKKVIQYMQQLNGFTVDASRFQPKKLKLYGSTSN